MKYLLKLLVIAIPVLCNARLYGQQQGQALIDSLLKELPRQREDTHKVKLLNNLSQQYPNLNADTGIKYAQAALTLAGKINWEKGKGRALELIGRNYWKRGSYNDALTYHFKALDLYLALGAKAQVADAYQVIGQDYADSGNFANAMKYFSLSLNLNLETNRKQRQAIIYTLLNWIQSNLGNYAEASKNTYAALKLYEETGDKNGVAISYANIGYNYMALHDYPEALKSFRAALKINLETGDLPNVAACYLYTGDVYFRQKNDTEALKNYFIALRLADSIHDKTHQASAHTSLGDIYKSAGKISEALKEYTETEKIDRVLNNKIQLPATYREMAKCHVKLGNYNEAGKLFQKAYDLSFELNYLEEIAQYYASIILFDSAEGKWQDAFEHYRKYVYFKDSIFNKETAKKLVQTQMQYDFDKKEAETKSVQDQKDATQRNIRNSILAGTGVMFIFSIVVYRQRNRVKKEKRKVEIEKGRSDELLLNILPAEVADELKAKGRAEAKMIDNVTVLFTDFKGFTKISESLSPEILVSEINDCFCAFDLIMQQYDIEKIKTIGDSYMAAGGLPTPNKTHPVDVVKAAIDILEFMEEHRKQREAEGRLFFEIRIGVHTGPVVAGIVGIKKFQYDIWGDTVNTASRMESSGTIGKVNISQSTYELVKDHFTCEYRGEIDAKGKGTMKMYFAS